MTIFYIKIIVSLVLLSAPIIIKLRNLLLTRNVIRLENFKACYIRNMVVGSRMWRILIYRGMTRSHTFRKFYIRCFVLALLLLLFLDFTATTKAVGIVTNNGGTFDDFAVVFSGDIIGDWRAYLALGNNVERYMITPFILNVIANVMTFMLFWYRFADWMLTLLHDRLVMAAVAMVAIALMLFSPNNILLAEVLIIYLIAAYYYPPFMGGTQPAGRHPLPVDNEVEKQLKVA